MEGDKRQTLVEDIRPDKQGERGWRLTVNGGTISDVKHFCLANPQFGRIEYGAAPGGAYDTWAFHEIGGGGSVTLPYALLEDDLYVGVVEQNRPNQGGKVFNVPRGFLASGESHFRAAEREFAEEVGLVEPFTVEELPGLPGNPNSAFFDTRGDGEGVKFFGVRIPGTCLESVSEARRYRLRKGMVSTDPASKAARVAEQILDTVFMPWIEVVQLSDMFSVAGAARLKALIMSRSRLAPAP